MAISIVPGSVSLAATARPSVRLPAVNGAFMGFTCNGIAFAGRCRLTGNAGDNPAGWTLGLIQAKWIDTDWAYYRGETNADGSSFMQVARPPALNIRACRDTLTPGGILIDNNAGVDRTVATAGAAFPINMTAAFSDAPRRSYPLTRIARSGKTHFLREAQIEIHFCTVLTLVSPTGDFRHLKSIYWNVHWQGRFHPTNFGNIAAAWTITRTGGALGNTANVSHVIDGTPTDRRFTGVLTAVGAPNCNLSMRAAFASPNIRESAIWADFDVTR